MSDLAPVYREIGNKLIQMEVPNSLASEHLQLANSFVIMADTFGIIDNQQGDPVKALLGLRIIQDTLPQQIDLFTKMSDYFNRNDILFSKGEYGVIWNAPGQTNPVATSTVPSIAPGK